MCRVRLRFVLFDFVPEEDWDSHRNRCKKDQDDKHCRASLNFLSDYLVVLTYILFFLPVDVIQDKFNRFPRRVAAVHINRQWNQIVTLAQGKNIPLSDIAVEIACTDFPLGIHAFDYHELLEGRRRGFAPCHGRQRDPASACDGSELDGRSVHASEKNSVHRSLE